MERRDFLRVVSGGLAGDLLLGLLTNACAQPVARTPATRTPPAATKRAVATRPPAPPPPAPLPTASAPGVSARSVRIGMSAAFKATAAGLGTELYRGAQAYYAHVNAQGGIHG
ncbi:MAG: hypothetical protein ACREJG_12545, partial [Candidatus Rokuibacteriota bacterium]